ncbi:uncharacterized protein AC631_04061 [Debaryomyces fabryi]|uniref:Uncharacterized protein n=1 Tax=Debaryomyces fabryi TaxID=58627 RepID=A0A0V1PVU8_9ASCO|nr:uncharacterized protein AC631_04061 [Debaryomyces fabryi]KSA00181.1 hypothetical protein AC631_04061 [Debaryomyces fabryi]CUM52151.1 unnamed protein product [Debaryomyces fabryi]
MDFEEQLEKAERLPTPSLVGSSIRSADDSAHNNYIHPEKSKGRKKEKSQGHGISNQSIAASLDDLMREGALLGSEEDFEEVLDDSGNIKEDAKYAGEDDQATKKSHLSTLAAQANDDGESGDVSAGRDDTSGKSVDEKTENGDENTASTNDKNIASIDKVDKETKSKEQNEEQVSEGSSSKVTPGPEKKSGVSFYSQEDYSTPNLSEYQLDHQISEHKDLLTNIQSYDPHRLPSSQSDYVHKDDDSYFKRPVSPSKRTPTSAVNRFNDDVTIAAGATDGLHTPYFQRDSRSQSRSGASRQDRSRSRSAVAPHLARGDSYKNTNMKDPSSYELPPDLAASEIKSEDEEEDETQDRRSRQSKPTMGESIAAAEASKELLSKSLAGAAVNMQRDASLVTTGDYTNFDVDKPEPQVQDSSNLYSMRSASSTNYLRSISRSRSRQPDKDLRASNLYNEKNDADPEELFKGGALINEDPYSTIGGLDTMVEEVLHPSAENPEVSKNEPELKDKSAIKQSGTKNNDDKEKPLTSEEESKPTSKPLDALIKDTEDIKNKGEATNELSSTTKGKSKAGKNDNQTEKSDKEGADDVDLKAVEQIESSLESKDPILDKAQSLHSDDIHGDSSEANTKLADSIITEDRENKVDVKSDEDNLDNAAIDQIESRIDSKNDIVEQAESLTAQDIHAKDKADETSDNSKADDKKETKNNNVQSVNTVGIEKIESSIDSKYPVGEETVKVKSKGINVDLEGNEDKLLNEGEIKKNDATKYVKGANSAKSDQSNDSNDKIDSENIISKSENAAKSTDLTGSTSATEASLKDKDTKETVEKEASKVNSAEHTKEEEVNVVDDKAVEQIESSTDSSDVTEKAKSLTADDIVAESTSKSKSVVQDKAIENEDKKDVDDKAVERIESSADSNDEVSEKAKSLTADEIVTDPIAQTKSVAVDEEKEKVSKKDLDDKAVEKIESSTDSSGVTEKAKSLTASDLLTDSSSKAVSKDLAEKKDKETELAVIKDSGLKEEGPVASKDMPTGSTKATAVDDDLSDIDVSPEELRKHLESQPVYIYTSLAGGMQVMTRTNRLTTILTANGIKFEYRDLGTDEEAKKIWRRQANGKTLPGVIRGDDYIGNWQEVDEANEEYRLREILYETL